MVSDKLIALIRTVVPAGVGALLAWWAVPDVYHEAVQVLAVTVATALFYEGARWLGDRYAWAGWLLGYPVAPTYVDDVDDVEGDV